MFTIQTRNSDLIFLGGLLIHTERFNLVFQKVLWCSVYMRLYEPAAGQPHLDLLVHSFTGEDQDLKDLQHSQM